MSSNAYARIEEERRFLLAALPKDVPADSPITRIHDRYINGTRLRLRRFESPSGEPVAFKLGQKFSLGEDGVRTQMTTFYLDEAEYDTLAALPALTLTKRRHAYEYDGLVFSLDAFEGPLAGLVLAELEARPGVDLPAVAVPAFAVREVTADPQFTGGRLVRLTAAEATPWLAAALAQ
ncbi:MAG: hypothetical protein EPO32_12405 [Anaerolineae bacterium]|nr:MAG: hypothetical protein EPO32_12405 [Anaerolineae bacterium]